MSSQSELIEAVQQGNIALLRDLLSRDPALAGSRDSAGLSALMHAVYRGRTDAIKLLRECELTLDIFEAAALGDISRLSTLLQQNRALVNAFGPDGFTPLHLAAFFNQSQAARLLLDHGADPAAVAKNPTRLMPLHSAASGRNLATVRDLLDRGAPVNARQIQGWTPLHSAAQNGQEEVIALLLQHGADLTSKNDEGVSPADVATKAGHLQLAKRLAAPA